MKEFTIWVRSGGKDLAVTVDADSQDAAYDAIQNMGYIPLLTLLERKSGDTE